MTAVGGDGVNSFHHFLPTLKILRDAIVRFAVRLRRGS